MLIMADLIALFAHHVIYSDVTEKEIGFLDNLLIIVALRKLGNKEQSYKPRLNVPYYQIKVTSKQKIKV